MSHVVFNFTNICRHTWLDRKDIKQLLIKDDNCQVILKTGEIIELKPKDLKPVIESKRRDSSINLDVLPTQFNTYLVCNPQSESEYIVEPRIDYLHCNCSDYKNQSIAFENKEVCCKHIFAVLEFLGFDNLKQYQSYVDDELAERMIELIADEKEYSELKHDREYI